jgi:ectoine hydroxylase-related dioxygenase (phytanoyl-CoA dioxygenase family)
MRIDVLSLASKVRHRQTELKTDMNKKPLIDVTEEDRLTYERDGVVVVRKVFDQDWIELLLKEAIQAVDDPNSCGLIPNHGNKYMSRTMPGFRKMIFESPAAQVAGELMGSEEIRFFYDEIFEKSPKSNYSTYWHTDRAGWPVSGDMVPSFWFPLTPVAKEQCLTVLARSQHDETLYWNSTSNSRQMVKPDDRPLFPDFEASKPSGDFEFLSWDMEPGDIMLVHPKVFHYGPPAGPTRRVAVSVRFFGDDIRWDPRPDCLNLAGIGYDEMVPGHKPAGYLFPLLWSKRGDRDGDATYPRGFATQWDLNSDDYKAPKRGPHNIDKHYASRIKFSTAAE